MAIKKICWGQRLRSGAVRAVLALLVLACAAASDSFALVTSTDCVKTDVDALELLSQRTDHGTDKFIQDYIYTGRDRMRGIAERPVVQADPTAAAVPAAKFTAQAKVITLNMKGRVPSLTAPKAPGLTAKDGQAGVMAKAAAAVKAAIAKGVSAVQSVKAWCADAFAAVKTWLISAKNRARDKIMGKGRPLTAEETAEMKKIFGDDVDYARVQVVTGENMGLWGKLLTRSGAAVTWGKRIYFPNDADGKSQYSFSAKSYWLAHEMTHEYQYQKYGPGYIIKSVLGQLTKGDAFYDYQLEPGKDFRKYNVEQQAELVEHYYRILNGSRSATPQELALYQEIMKNQGLF